MSAALWSSTSICINQRNMKRLLSVAVASLALASGSEALAQAWVGPPNSLSVSLGYNFSPSNKIVETSGLSIPGHPILAHTIFLGAEYVTPLPGLALTAQLPLLGVAYKGEGDEAEAAFARHGRYDDGSYHFTLSDLRADLRYMPIDDPLAISIHVGGSFPVAEYETVGFATAGRHLLMGHFGVSLGYIIWDIFAHVRYEFTLGQRYETNAPDTGDVAQNRSDLNVQIGYIILEGLEFHAAVDWRLPHGGINFTDFPTLSQAQQDYHDVLLREGFLLVGGGGSYEVVDGFTIAALFRIFTTGTNTRDGHVFGLTMTYEIF